MARNDLEGLESHERVLAIAERRTWNGELETYNGQDEYKHPTAVEREHMLIEG
jgi:hypothetical protein